MTQRTLDSHGRFVLPLLESGLTVLDVGCGPGTITHGIAESVLPGRVTAIDNDPRQIARAQRIAEGLELVNARFLTAPAENLPFSANSFDLVFSHALFEHLDNPAAALAEFRRVLRPGGLAALCSPDLDSFTITSPTREASTALARYRELQESRGWSSCAGTRLGEWLTEAGFGILHQGTRWEPYESTAEIANHFARALDEADEFASADALRAWSENPDAELLASWKHTVAIRWNQ